MSHAEVYSQSMSYLGHGAPLWHPEPADTGEIAIGDVGVIRDGQFHRLFNVTASAVHPLNKSGVPAEFVPFYCRNTLLRTCAVYLKPGIYTSRNVSIRRLNDTNVPDTIPPTYCVEAQGDGGLLILGSGARQEVLMPNRRLNSYVRTNRHHWHKYALDYGETCALEDLILVRGVVKTSADWMLAALTRAEPKHQSVPTFPPVTSLSPPITLEPQTSTEMVPRFGAITLTSNTGDGKLTCNMDQCIFINFRRAKNHGHETTSKSCKIYQKQLASLGHGVPLWRPGIRLPSHTLDTAKLGDVGIVYDGAFHRIFNITVESSDPLNQLGVPDDFEPYRIGSATTYYLSPDVYASNAVHVQLNRSCNKSPSGVTPLYKVTCEGENGALLILHEPAISKVLSPNKVFRYYMAQNRNAWHDFISNHLNIPVDLDDIILVQGFMKCPRWTAASFLSHNKTNGFVEGAFNVKGLNTDQEELVWVDERRNNMSMEVRSGAESTGSPDCVFLVKFAYEDWNLMKAVSRTFRTLPKNPLGTVFQRMLGGSPVTLNDRSSRAPRRHRRTSFAPGTPSDSSYMYTADTSRRSRSMLSVSAASEPAKGLSSWLLPRWLGPTSRTNGPSTPSRPTFTSAPASISGRSPVLSRQSSIAPPIDFDRPYIQLDLGGHIERFAQSFVKTEPMQDFEDPHASTSSNVVKDFEKATTGEARDEWMKYIIRLVLYHNKEEEYLEVTERTAKVIATHVLGEHNTPFAASGKRSERSTHSSSIYAEQITPLNLTDFSTDHDAGVSRALDLILRQDHPYEQIVTVALSNVSCSTGLADVVLEKMQEILDELQAQRLVMENPNNDILRQWSSLRKVLLRLCKTLHRVPPSLFLTDIVCLEHEHPVDGGSFSDIFMATRQGQPVALKRLRVFRSDFSAVKDLTKASFHQEIVVWRQLRHPNILPLLGLDQDTFRDVEMICMVSPWMAYGNINQCIQKLFVQNETVPLTNWVHGIASGLRYLHDENLVHGDLRGANILVDNMYHVRIADFGLTRLADLTGSRTPYFPGASRWVAPEILSGLKPSIPGDVYAFGCVCLEICTMKAPFHEFVEHQVITMKITHRKAPDWPERKDSSAEAKIRNAVLSCWNWDAASRPRMIELERELKTLMHEVEFAITPTQISWNPLIGDRGP